MTQATLVRKILEEWLEYRLEKKEKYKEEEEYVEESEEDSQVV